MDKDVKNQTKCYLTHYCFDLNLKKCDQMKFSEAVYFFSKCILLSYDNKARIHWIFLCVFSTKIISSAIKLGACCSRRFKQKKD